MKNHVLYFINPYQLSIKEEPIPIPKSDELLIRNVISGVSAGTEMLFYAGMMPTEMQLDSNIPSLSQQISYPFKYGYCSLGTIIEAGNKKLQSFIGKKVFVFNPHESFFCTTQDQLIILPEDLSLYDALFIPNMETAINLILDGSPLIGENVLVLGLGILGLLTTALLQQFPLAMLMGSDLYESRRNISLELGAKLAFDASQAKNSIDQNPLDLIFELSGNPEALNSAIELIGYEGRIVLGSWYGKKSGNIDLGGKFHRQRIKLIASQVSTLASELQGRWNKNRRFEIVFNMLKKLQPSRFISHKFHITEADKAYQLIHQQPQDTLQVMLTYED